MIQSGARVERPLDFRIKSGNDIEKAELAMTLDWLETTRSGEVQTAGAVRPKVVIANWVHGEVIDRLSADHSVTANQTKEPLERSELQRRCADADALIAFMTEEIDDDFLAGCPGLRIVACALKGYDNFDVEACSRRGVWLTIVPDLLTAPTAELTIGMMIALARNIGPGSAAVRGGAFAGWRPRFYGRSLDGSTVGLIGAGAVGKAIARRLTGFRANLLYFDRERLTPDQEDELRLQRVALSELQARSDFIVLALPLAQDSLHLVDRAFLAQTKPGSFLINPARGSLVDEAAVADALDAGTLAGYAADTFEMEDWARCDRPDAIDPRLLKSDRAVLTPHLGSAVDSIRLEIALEAAESVIQCLQGARPKGAINTPAGVFEKQPAC